MNAAAPSPRLPAALRPASLRFRARNSLITRILIVNLVALIAFAGALFYLENFRARLLEQREQEMLRQGSIIAQFVENQGVNTAEPAILDITSANGARIRLYDSAGRLVADNWRNPKTTRFTLEDPATPGFNRTSAIAIDRLVDFLTGQKEYPPLRQADDDVGAAWPEALTAARSGRAVTAARQTNDRLVVLQAAVPVLDGSSPSPVVVLTVDTPDVVQMVRRERTTSFLVFLGVLGLSLAMTLYLARTVIVPLRQLAFAAHRVRLGRARDVVVPRLPHRRDEIGGLARALADMTAALRHRIDATEAFAADVAHELKNPLASLRSAVEALGSVRDKGARAQLFALIDQDVRRIDRLITDISAASRLEAELSRVRPQPVDLGEMVAGMTSAKRSVGPWRQDVRLELDVPPTGTAMVLADADRISQVVGNLIDNALSFSPSGSTIEVRVHAEGHMVELCVADEGPGVPPELRDAIFERFYSERPGDEAYGGHSGLGLSIARAIVEAMDGRIRVEDRADGKPGAVFHVLLPAL